MAADQTAIWSAAMKKLGGTFYNLLTTTYDCLIMLLPYLEVLWMEGWEPEWVYSVWVTLTLSPESETKMCFVSWRTFGYLERPSIQVITESLIHHVRLTLAYPNCWSFECSWFIEVCKRILLWYTKAFFAHEYHLYLNYIIIIIARACNHVPFILY